MSKVLKNLLTTNIRLNWLKFYWAIAMPLLRISKI